MTRVIIVALLLSFTVGLCVYENNSIYNSFNDAQGYIDEMTQNFEEKKFDSAVKSAEKLEKLWNDAEDRLFFVSNSESLENIGVIISKLPFLAKEKSDEFLSETRAARVMLEHFVDRKRYYIY